MPEPKIADAPAVSASPSASSSTSSHAADEMLKNVMDYTVTVIGLVLISPILLLLALIVRLDSPGPVIYRRRVMGRHGTQFDAFKFRTMVVNGDKILNAHPDLKALWEHDQKLENDPRVTRSGNWLRKLSLDELPQLFNVLRGEMSLVGPRMIAPVEVARYGKDADQVFAVKPGITGLWQVSGRSNLSYQDRARLDLEYVHTRSIGMDIKLLVMTIPVVILKRGAF
jgi:lipopolysaccharide/colanic/teichoic acid biosynthesis glycosyltransferase